MASKRADPETEACIAWAESGELSARGFAKALPKIAHQLRTTRKTEAEAEAFAENLAKDTVYVTSSARTFK
jgi:hypothetical protein